MASQTRRQSLVCSKRARWPGWRRTVAGTLASSAVALGLVAGFGAPTALADDGDPTPQADAPPAMTADQVLAIIAKDYDTGAGGGQLSNLIHSVLKLRAQGFYPSNANKQAIVKALDYRPNQAPLVAALQETLAYQNKVKAQMAASGQQPNPIVMGVNQLPPGQQPTPANPGNAGAFIGGGLPISQPVG